MNIDDPPLGLLNARCFPDSQSNVNVRLFLVSAEEITEDIGKDGFVHRVRAICDSPRQADSRSIKAKSHLQKTLSNDSPGSLANLGWRVSVNEPVLSR